MNRLFSSDGQSIGASASASVLPMNIQDWFPLGSTGWISLQSKGLWRIFSNTADQKHQFFSTQLSLWSNSHIYTWLLEKKVIVLTRRTFVGKVMCLLFNMLSRLVLAFLPRSKCLLISWLQSPSAMILEPKKIKSVTVSIVSPSIFHEVMGLDIYNASHFWARWWCAMLCLVAQSCPTLCDPMDCSPPASCPWGFSRQEYWSGLPCPPPGDLPNPGIEPRSPALQADSLPSEPPGKPRNTGVGSLSLLQGIFLTQELNQGLLHCKWILYQLSYQGSPDGDDIDDFLWSVEDDSGVENQMPGIG